MKPSTPFGSDLLQEDNAPATVATAEFAAMKFLEARQAAPGRGAARAVTIVESGMPRIITGLAIRRQRVQKQSSPSNDAHRSIEQVGLDHIVISQISSVYVSASTPYREGCGSNGPGDQVVSQLMDESGARGKDRLSGDQKSRNAMRFAVLPAAEVRHTVLDDS